MGSLDTEPVPPEHQILTWPTEAEKRATWTHTHPNWGSALSLPDYLRREEFLLTVPLAKDGGMTHWILTDGRLPPDARPVLASCESLRKRALVCRPDGAVVDAVAHGIASVFTEPRFRGRGYASRMMRLLGHQLRGWQGPAHRPGSGGPGGEGPPLMEPGRVAFSVLYSDIGRSFYAAQGWAPFESTHLRFPPSPPEDAPPPASVQATADDSSTNGTSPQVTAEEPAPKAKTVGYHELAELCAADERNLRQRLRVSRPWTGKTTRTALIPDLDTVLWHLMREDYMTKHIFGRTPLVRGAVYGDPGARVWAVWTRGYYGGLDGEPAKNTLHVLRFAVEDDKAASDEHLLAGLKAVVAVARDEARDWRVGQIEMWNPVPQLRELVGRSGLEHEFVVRDKDSIASMNWYGDGPADEVDWVANEKFAWC